MNKYHMCRDAHKNGLAEQAMLKISATKAKAIEIYNFGTMINSTQIEMVKHFTCLENVMSSDGHLRIDKRNRRLPSTH